MNDAAPSSGAMNNIAPDLASRRGSAIGVPTFGSSQATGLTPEALVDLQCPEDVRLAPSGTHVVYCLRPASRRGDHETSSLWTAEVGKEHSAQQFTSGLFNDDLRVGPRIARPLRLCPIGQGQGNVLPFTFFPWRRQSLSRLQNLRTRKRYPRSNGARMAVLLLFLVQAR